MHDESQVQDSGNGRDATAVVDPAEGPEHRCGRCGKGFTKPKWCAKHEASCDGTRPKARGEGKEGTDWVKCEVCGFKARTLGKHLTQVHGMTQQAYAGLHPSAKITCDASAETFKARGQNFAWLKRAKERGDDLSEYRSRMSVAVRNAVMSDPEERKRRSEQMAANNRTTEARERSSRTAKVTSARPDVIEARTLRLQNSYKPSRGERAFESFLKPLGFKRNMLISDASFQTPSKRRQVDFVNHASKVLVEFDGQHHFCDSWKRLSIDVIHQNDRELDRWAIKNGYMLIRVGWKSFKYKSDSIMDECKHVFHSLLKNIEPRVVCIGNEYNTLGHPSAANGTVYQLSASSSTVTDGIEVDDDDEHQVDHADR